MTTHYAEGALGYEAIALVNMLGKVLIRIPRRSFTLSTFLMPKVLSATPKSYLHRFGVAFSFLNCRKSFL